jgi:integrase
MKITKSAVSSLVLPPGKSDMAFWDDDIPGFGIRLQGESRVWVFRYRVGTKQRRMTLGSAKTINDYSVQLVRKQAAQLHARVKLGEDPAGAKFESQARASETFEAVLRKYLTWQQARLRRRSYVEVERHLVKDAKALHRLQLAKIDRRTIAGLLGDLGEHPSVPDKVRASLSKFFVWAMQEGLVDANPVIGTNKGKATARDRVLTNSELAAIWHALPVGDYGDIVKLLILTGQRREEIGALRWSEVDLDQELITLPEHRTKNYRKHHVPLAPAALAILKARPQAGDFVFGRSKGFNGWSKCKAALDQVLAVAPWHLHDCRRTLSTGMHDQLDIPPHIVEAVLNHVSGQKAGVAGTYNLARYDKQKAVALARWEEHVLAIVEGREAQVVTLRQHR